MTQASKLADRTRVYRGSVTEPERWDVFHPRVGDVILCTPAKAGTTWTQSMIAMLLHRSAELPERLSVLSPWIDSNFSALDSDLAALDRQVGRRVIKTHTPADGWPVWEGVPVVACFRHPLEIFLSIRKHIANSTITEEHPLLEPIDAALPEFLNKPFDENDIDRDSLEVTVRHFEAMALSDRLPEQLVLNYAGISRDHEGTVRRLDAFLGTSASEVLIREIVAATGFSAMQARASDFAPEASNNLWHDNRKFFASGRSSAWQSDFTPDQIALYDARFREVLPDETHRHWIETGQGDV